jgi:hypothetical protein
MMLLLLAVPLAAWPDSRDQLAKEYSDLAGSDANSKSLVDGLRDGKQVTLKSADGKTTTTFTPPTGTMGNGNVKIALELAQADLAKQGINNPTNEQLKTELMKILQERADHKGWGVIAKERGFKVGDLMRSEKGAENSARGDKLERQARADKVERPDKPERPEKPERPDRSGRGPH